MDHFQQIYTKQASEYQRMIAAEDFEGNLLPALLRAAPLEGHRILDLGGGTGRIPLLLRPLGGQILSLDLHRAMLLEQKRQRARVGGSWPMLQADMRRLPISCKWADAAIAGWSIGHLRGWFPADWRTQIGMALSEMERVVCPGGSLIILETLTTGSLVPAPPSPELAEYYDYLEGEWGFTLERISTDYQFESVQQAVEYTEFFLGSELANEIKAKAWARLPEWTGVWRKKIIR
jgi:ubiquinone/menaquinone biosynthesis C-methylase UbiE